MIDTFGSIFISICKSNAMRKFQRRHRGDKEQLLATWSKEPESIIQ